LRASSLSSPTLQTKLQRKINPELHNQQACRNY
jgi:hypothetical protein